MEREARVHSRVAHLVKELCGGSGGRGVAEGSTRAAAPTENED
jgi:hypothetical protein